MNKTEITTVERAEWPEWLAQLAASNSIFEGLDASVPSVPVDWEQVRHRLAVARLTRLIELQRANRARHPTLFELFDQTIAALAVVLRCHESSLLNSAAVDWLSAQSAAREAEEAVLAEWSEEWSAESAATAAWWSAQNSAQSVMWSAWWAARSAAEAFDTESTEWSAESAEWSAWWARAAAEAEVFDTAESAAAWWAAWQTERDDLLAILRNLNTTNQP